MKTLAVGYIRVSTDKQADNGVSLAAQRCKIEAYASLYDLEIVEVIQDAGGSAKTLQRDGLQRALALLDAGKADALIVAKLDRLTRSTRDLGTLLDRYFSKRCDLLSVSEQVDTRSAGGRLVLNVLMSVAQWEREAIGERTSAAMQHKARNGEYNGGRPPYGSQLAADGVHLEPHTGEQLVIEAVQELRAAGLTLRAIAAELSKRNLHTRKGRAFAPTQLSRILAA